MSDLSELFGNTPRVQLLEALIRLGPTEVTRGELAHEAGLYRTSTNREIAKLEHQGLIIRVSKGTRPRYVANSDLAELKLVAYLDAALSSLRIGRGESLAAVEAFRKAVWQTVSLTMTAISTQSEIEVMVPTGSEVTAEVESTTSAAMEYGG